jgi:hypothetical protein
MSFTFRPALRENVGLIIGLAGGTGSGKTYSALRLASGIAGERRFCVIDTEAGRAKHYADAFTFDHGDLKAPFTPERYTEAIMAADAAGYPVIVVDSMSHEHAGDGGLLDMQEAEFARMGSREAVRMASWIKPKMAHKAMVQKLLQIRSHLILCFRAEPKVEMVKGRDGRIEVVPKESPTGLHGWIPVSEKNLPYELTASFLLTADAPGMPKPIKLQEQHRALFPSDQPITEESGRRLAAWASGAKQAKHGAVAQPEEQSIVDRQVAGSSPAGPATDVAPQAPEPARAGTEAMASGASPVAATPGKPILYTLPGKRAVRMASIDDWLDNWNGTVNAVLNSSRLSPEEKEQKVQQLKRANEGNIRALGAHFIARMHTELAECLRRIHEGTSNEPNAPSTSAVSTEPKAGG